MQQIPGSRGRDKQQSLSCAQDVWGMHEASETFKGYRPVFGGLHDNPRMMHHIKMKKEIKKRKEDMKKKKKCEKIMIRKV